MHAILEGGWVEVPFPFPLSSPLKGSCGVKGLEATGLHRSQELKLQLARMQRVLLPRKD